VAITWSKPWSTQGRARGCYFEVFMYFSGRSELFYFPAYCLQRCCSLHGQEVALDGGSMA
jgi:hypothetical protein